MKALKVLVFLMAILLVVGFVVLGVMIFKKMNEGEASKQANQTPTHIDGKIKYIKEIGNKIVIIANKPKSQVVVITDPQSGKIVNQIEFHPTSQQ